MIADFIHITPKVSPPLDENFQPAVLVNRAFQELVQESGSPQRVVLGLARGNGSVSRYETNLLPEDHPRQSLNGPYLERILKFLLWQRGGATVYLGGTDQVRRGLKMLYSPGAEREFDFSFMSRIYDRDFQIIVCDADQVPAEKEAQRPLGRNLNGNRIGFDLGASDLKVSAVVNGEAIFSTEIEWHPVEQTDPRYHQTKIREALDLAASKLVSLDAIGGSSAGVHINNRPMIASLYRSIPQDKFDLIHDLFLNLSREFGVPLEIVNDGEVTALAGSMSLNENAILGIAMGSSQAVGYITQTGKITDWLNELAFAPIDYQAQAPIDEWSGDKGVGALYFSQQCVFRLAPQLGIMIPADLSKAGKLKFVQACLESGRDRAHLIWETMGVYLGYALAHYADFYDMRHVLILGRCTSGQGGGIILDQARKVLDLEFPDLAQKLNIQLPDEKSRRVGQSIAAASLPFIG